MIRFSGVLIGLLGLTAGTLCAADWSGYRFYKLVDRTEAVEQILGIGIDGPVFAVVGDGMPDIRVVNSGGRETPFVIERKTIPSFETSRRYRTVKVEGLEKQPDDSLEITVKLSDGTPSADGLRLHTPLKDFEHQVRVFGSRDATEWVERVAGTPIYDYSRYMDVANLEIELPAGEDRYFKLVIRDVTDDQASPLRELRRTSNSAGESQREERTKLLRRDFRIDHIQAWWNVQDLKHNRVVTRTYELSEMTVTEDTEHKHTVIEFGSNRAPLTQFVIQTASRNFSRSVRLQLLERAGSDAAFATPRWRDIGSGNVSRVSFRAFQRQHLEVIFPEQRQDRYRLIVENGDNQALNVTDVVAAGPVYQAIVMAEAEQEYRLYYGDSAAEAPSYDAFRVQSQLPSGVRVADVRLGSQVSNPDYRAGGEAWRGVNWLSNRVTLGVAITMMVVALGWVLVRSGERVKQLPADEE
ncbi:MAG: DUF3999 family protein [Planctomycetaceae bacterium]